MKNYINTISFLSLLFTLFSGVCYGQIKALGIGDKCPEEFMKQLSTFKTNIGHVKKPIIIDFWATYCAPCVRKIPLLDSLQNENEARLLIVLANEQKDLRLAHEVLNKIENGKGRHTIFSDTLLRKYFPHSTLPHYVWIDSNNVVSGFTSNIDRNSVLQFLNKNKLVLSNKATKINYKSGYPLYAAGQIAAKEEVVYQSVIAKYRPDISTIDARGDNFITVANNSILHLYQIAFGKFDLDFLDLNRMELMGITSTADSAKLGAWKRDMFNIWNKDIHENAFTYEIYLPGAVSSDDLFILMQKDLNRYFSRFGVEGSLELKEKKVMSLTRLKTMKSLSFESNQAKSSSYTTPNTLKLSKVPMSLFLAKVRGLLGYIDFSIINKTGYDGEVSLELNGDLNNLVSLNTALGEYGLILEEKTENLPTLIIRKVSNTAK